MSSAGSEDQLVEKAPSQPKRPGLSATPPRRVIIDRPKPQPRLSQKPGKKGEAAFCSAVI